MVQTTAAQKHKNQKQLKIYNSKNVLTKKVKSKLIKTKIITQKQKQNLKKSQNYKFLSILRLKELKNEKASRF